MNSDVKVSAVVPVSDRYDNSGSLAREYLKALNDTGRDFELVFVLDGKYRQLGERLLELAVEDKRLRIIQLAKSFGEATAVSAGIENTNGGIVLTLPAYHQIEAGEVGKLLAELEHSDMAVAVRWPRAAASKFEVFRRKVFHWLVSNVSGISFSDLGCGARAFKREVGDEIPIYGDQHRFIPLLALRRGFSVSEINVRQSEKDKYEKGYGPRTYLQRFLDIFTVVFLVRFTKKPLRFFGMIGSVTFVMGALFLTYVVIERLFFGVNLSDRPALLLSSLLVVLGMQIFALGLLGELIIFTHARDMKEYTIEKIVN
jgi:glycosyltransferase involved in cell wall biosynthesis